MSAVHNSYSNSGRPRRRGSGTKGTDYQNKPYEPVHGRWEKSTTKGLVRCSACGLEQLQRFDRCPMCKAVMDK